MNEKRYCFSSKQQEIRSRRPGTRRAGTTAAAVAVVLGIGAAVFAVATGGGEKRTAPSTASTASAAKTVTLPPRPPFAVGLSTLHLVDRSRQAQLPGGAAPRKLTTYVRYPVPGRPSERDRYGAAPLRSIGALPLIVFAHGFATTPSDYAELMRAWARAGYVVAAPVFPLEYSNAPGGPDETDLPNQPGDVSFVISRLLAQDRSAGSPFYGLIDPRQIGVAGHSDGGETALAVAYDRRFLDRRIDAAAILSGARIPGVGGFTFSSGSPPLLAVQGSADTINPPSATNEFYGLARPPKFMLTLLGASHLPPYTGQEPQLRIVERVTLAFFDRYLKGLPVPIARLRGLGDRPGLAALRASP